jgi:hypothetical protein
MFDRKPSRNEPTAYEPLGSGIWILVDLESQKVLSYHFVDETENFSPPCQTYRQAEARQADHSKWLESLGNEPMEEIPF